MEDGMVKEHSLPLMEVSMKVNGRMVKDMGKEHTLTQMEVGMKGNIKMIGS